MQPIAEKGKDMCISTYFNSIRRASRFIAYSPDGSRNEEVRAGKGFPNKQGWGLLAREQGFRSA
jgi:hypothetical protein